MRLRPYTRRLGGWIVLWTLAFAALAPALSRMLGDAATPGWFEVCTPAGAKLVATDDGTTRPKQSPVAALLDHCPYCAWQHALVALPVAIASLTLLPLRFALPERFYDAPRTSFAWAAPRPRGPPLQN